MQRCYHSEVRGFDQTFRVLVEPSRLSGAIMINVPGYNGSVDGYNRKYHTLAKHIAHKRIAAYIQMPNLTRPNHYTEGLRQDLLAVCRFAEEHSGRLCGVSNPRLYLVGFSAGGGAVAAIAADVRSVSSILLMEPSAMRDDEVVASGLRRFTGNVHIVVGDAPNDSVGTAVGEQFRGWSQRANTRRLHVIPGCNHQFHGKQNGQIMAKAHEWAFAGDTTFPDPEGGLVLYD